MGKTTDLSQITDKLHGLIRSTSKVIRFLYIFKTFEDDKVVIIESQFEGGTKTNDGGQNLKKN
jgi:hypothetical protein